MRLEPEARREFEFFAAGDFEPLTRDGVWLPCMTSLVDTCIFLRDRERADRLYALLDPYAGRVVGTTLGGVFSVGEPLGKLATLLGRYEDAERHLRDALRWAKQAGVRPIRVRALIELARMYVERGAPGDAGRALEHVNEALPVAREFGMGNKIEQGLTLKLEIQGADTGDASRSIVAVASSVQARRPDLEAHASPDGTVTLMFSDLEGFTQMTEQLGDAAMHRLMQVHHHIVREQTAAHGGHEVELRGDGFLLAFADGPGAVRCAVALQSAFARHSRENPGEALRVRIGLHTGEVIQDRDTFFGKTVIQAFRIADLAVGGEILVSSDLRALVEDLAELRFDEPREVSLKGMSGRHRIFPVRWQ
jgi:class 3 adenylate cyclase